MALRPAGRQLRQASDDQGRGPYGDRLSCALAHIGDGDTFRFVGGSGTVKVQDLAARGVVSMAGASGLE
jgi:hypothetical protein